MMNRAELVDYYISKIQEGNFEIDQIRKELSAKQIEEEEIRTIVRLVDNELQKKAISKTGNRKSKEMFYVGVILVIVGLGITLGTYTGIIDTGDSFLIVYGPFLVGLSLIFSRLVRR